MSGKRIHLAVLESTNSYTKELLSQNDIEPWTIVSCDYQSAGRGQRGKVWLVEPGENLTISVYIKPMIPLADQFLISAAVVKGLIDAFSAYGLDAQFKWPNDILIGGKKVAGVLIENIAKDGFIESSIIGIGLNVNQLDFPEFHWPATSIRAEIGRSLPNLEEVLTTLITTMQSAFDDFNTQRNRVIPSLLPHLFRNGEKVNLKIGSTLVAGEVLGLADDGGLRLVVDGQERVYYSGEVSLMHSDA